MALLAGFAAFALSPAHAQDEASMRPGKHPLEIHFRKLPSFKVRDEATQFGQLKWMGGGVLSSSNAHLGGLSSLVGFDHGRRLLAISDNGLWVSMDLQLDGKGMLMGISDAWIAPMLDANGHAMIRKAEADSESLTRRASDGALLVGFEGRPRILVYRQAAGRAEKAEVPLPANVERHIGGNTGLESLAWATSGPLAGALVAIGERDRQRDDRLPGWILRPGKAGSFFSLKAKDNYSATDAAFLPDGALLLLERRFNLAQGVGMRIRRFDAAKLEGGDGLDGETLIDVNLAYQIDNMEGLSVDVDEAGRVLLTVISDDNRSILQRTLLERFQLVGADVHDAPVSASGANINGAPRPKPVP